MNIYCHSRHLDLNPYDQSQADIITVTIAVIGIINNIKETASPKAYSKFDSDLGISKFVIWSPSCAHGNCLYY